MSRECRVTKPPPSKGLAQASRWRGELLVTRVKRNRRDGVALIASATAHIVVIAILVSQATPEYVLPEPPAPPMDVQIMRIPEIPPPPIVPPKMTPRKIVTQAAPPPAPAPPTPEPKPTPAPPAPQKPLPAKPTPPKPTTVVVAPARPTPPTPQPQPPKPAPPKPAPPSPPSPAPAPAKLNIHKPKEEAPASVATLPMAPSPAPASAGAPPGGSQAPSSRLSGLNPFPLGAFPSGGTGLRGTLVGCANADSVHLSSVERAHCNERFGVEITRAPALDGIAPSKRAAFDKAAAAQDRSLHAGAMDPMGSMEARHGRPTDYGGGVVTGPGSSFIKPGGP